jgi:hypothetical protein
LGSGGISPIVGIKAADRAQPRIDLGLVAMRPVIRPMNCDA